MKQTVSLSTIVLFSIVLLSCSQPIQPVTAAPTDMVASPMAYTVMANRENPARVKTQDCKMNSLAAFLKDCRDWFTQCFDDAMLAIVD